MARYIDADALQKSLNYICTGGGKWGEAERMFIEAFSDFVDGCPTADVVEVVRCKDCKNSEHWYRDKCRCSLWSEIGIDVFEDGFCSYGERRDDG